MSIACLPMYDFAELRPATDALWAAIATRLADAGIDAPMKLTRGRALEDLWSDPDLLLGQTCGYPLVTRLRDRVTLLTTPCYGAAGCEGTHYRSVVVVRATATATRLADLRHGVCAVNDPASNSGMNLLRTAIAPLAGASRFFSAIVMTGSHSASAQAVADGGADLASIDCITWAHLCRLRPDTTARLRVLAWTDASPGLPLITSLHTTAATCAALLRALHSVTADPALAPVHEALQLLGFETVKLSDYDSVLAMEVAARAAHYPTLW